MLNFLNSKKYKKIFSVINTTFIANPYISEFPKEWFQKIDRDWTISQYLKSTFLFYLKNSLKLSNFILQKVIFSILWRKEIKVSETVFDTFLLSERVIQNGKYEDSYLIRIYEVFHKRGLKFSYLPRIYGLGLNPLRFIRLLQILKKEDKNFIFEYQLISFTDIFKILLQIYIYPFETLQLLQNDKTRENRLFNFHLVKDISNQPFEPFTRYLAGKKLAEFQEIKKIISWSEFQVIERAFNFGYRLNGGNGKIYGTQFYLSYPNYFNTFVFDIDYENLSSPHFVLVNGKYYLQKRKHNFYRLGVSLRYRDIFTFVKNEKDRNDILLLTSYLKKETKEMLDFCKDLSLNIKLHPTQKPSDFQIPKNFKLVYGNLYEFFQTSKIVITTGSGTAVEAVAVGVSVIIIASQNNLTSNPLVDFGEGEIWDSANSKEELLEKMHKLENFRKENPERITEISKWYKENFFIEPTEENIVKAFDL